MSKEIFPAIHEASSKMDGPEPRWLIETKEPEFQFEETGNGNINLLLLHGLFGAMTNWDGTIPYFNQFSNTIALHFPLVKGHRSEVKIKSLALYSEYFIRQKQFKKPLILCGNSLGGHVALRLAMSSPDLADALVLTGSSGLYEHTVDTLPIRPSKDFIESQMQRVFYNHEFITSEGIEEVYSIMNNKAYQLNIIHAARSAKKDFLLDSLKNVNVPVLLVWGKDDQVTSMDVARTFEKHIPNAKLVAFDKCGHAPMIEYPEQFASAVKEFLAENSLL